MQRTFVVIPAFNEGKRLLDVVKKTHTLDPKLPIIIIDDGSRIAVKSKLPFTTVLRHPINLGKGAALKTGIEYGFDHGADSVVIMDADGQHNPDDIPVFVDNLNKNYDLVFGVRNFSTNTPLVRFLGNKFASVYLNLFFGVYISDTLCGFRAFSKKAYSNIHWQSQRYGVEPEIVARLGKHQNDLRHIEVPINTIYHDKYKGATIIDALQILINSIWWKLS